VWHKARIRVESNFKKDAKSIVGAVGLAQFMPETALAYGADSLADRLDPVWSINAMVRYIKDIWNLFEGAGTVDRQMLSDAGYNYGQGRVLGITKKVGLTWEKVTPKLPKETQAYSPLIQKWKKVYGGVL
jgi:soluble lytic murein transglycosylase-like protein